MSDETFEDEVEVSVDAEVEADVEDEDKSEDEVLQALLGEEAATEAEDIPGPDVDLDAKSEDSPEDSESILGATPAEVAPEEPDPEPETETPYEKYQRLLDEGYKRAELRSVCNSSGRLIAVELA